ncbi:multiple epidermal growth factor-like domains 10 [Plakobranchus ocellatus]|uniref:Multiple epidermal growth factor-like domains 10 n=1 Tax=Plakobranchus ocellatus TaxID=259542 RepID=A0AAV3ZV69_9GAST|nr:multiple epidermal growth factor-like domains 10 [Plakobranchus ocellatus]
MFFSCERIFAAILILTTSLALSSAYCKSKIYFGKKKCKYLCHCKNNTNCNKSTGLCSDGCAFGWFGPACQFKSATFFPIANESDFDWLTDNDPTTCNKGDIQEITVELNTSYPLTWMRVMLNRPIEFDSLEIRYRTPKDTSKDQVCSDAQTAKVDNVTFDLSCPTLDLVSHVILSGSGVGSLCSLDISKGRNIAIKQDARQSSTFKKWYARGAVDGDYGPIDGSEKKQKTTCSHTSNRHSDAWWSVVFSAAMHVQSFVIYNRRNPSREKCCEFRLSQFSLKAYKSTHYSRKTQVFNFKDQSSEAQDVYTIIPSPRIGHTVKTLKIAEGQDFNILTLCEVIVYGDSACSSGKFGLDCERDCNCINKQETCFVSTGGCPSGCAPGFKGEDCWTQCPISTYGKDCKMNCSSNCLNSDCHHETGVCKACVPGYTGELCNQECPVSTYGQDCKMICNTRCLNCDCHHKTGVCKTCVPGYIGDLCDQECPISTYGKDCKMKCSSSCLDSDCHHETGLCKACVLGYTGELCYQASPPQGDLTPSDRALVAELEPATDVRVDRLPLDPFTLTTVRKIVNFRGTFKQIYVIFPLECPVSTYGQDCKMNCSTRCLNSDCHHKTGVCKACLPGYNGDLCDQGTFGDGCNQNCSIYCLDKLCNHMTGKCNNCTVGMEGDYCNESIYAAKSKACGYNLAVLSAFFPTSLVVTIVIFCVFYAIVLRCCRDSCENLLGCRYLS